jgi:hypothetical protein
MSALKFAVSALNREKPHVRSGYLLLLLAQTYSIRCSHLSPIG